MTETIQHPDGRVELRPEALAEISQTSLYNEDLAPVPISKRNWTTKQRLPAREDGPEERVQCFAADPRLNAKPAAGNERAHECGNV